MDALAYSDQANKIREKGASIIWFFYHDCSKDLLCTIDHIVCFVTVAEVVITVMGLVHTGMRSFRSIFVPISGTNK